MTKVTRWVFLFRFFFQLKSNKVPHHFAWSRARLVLFQWRALGPRLDNAGVNADSPPRTNRHGKEAEETIISVCVQELNGLICGNTSSFTLMVKDCSQRTEKRSSFSKLCLELVPPSPESSLSLSITDSHPSSKRDGHSYKRHRGRLHFSGSPSKTDQKVIRSESGTALAGNHCSIVWLSCSAWVKDPLCTSQG